MSIAKRLLGRPEGRTTRWVAVGVGVIDLRETFAGTRYEELRVSSLDARPIEPASELVAKRLLPLF